MTKFQLVRNYVSYFMNLDQIKVINMIRYMYKDQHVVYAIKCRISGMLYVGSTTTPSSRFHHHLITYTYSNAGLQAAIAMYGLSNFTLYILEVVTYPSSLTLSERGVFLRQREQSYMNKFPVRQLYNSIKSSS